MIIVLGHSVSIESAYADFPLVINSNFARISYRFRDIDAFSLKIACFSTPLLFNAA